MKKRVLLVQVVVMLFMGGSYGATEQDTNLLSAADKGDVAGIQKALQQGANINAQKPLVGSTALMLATARGHVNAVKTLLAVPGIDLKVKNNVGRTALNVALWNKNIHLVKKRKDYEAIIPLLKEAENKQQK